MGAEIQAGIFDGMSIPNDTQSNLDNAVGEWRDFTSDLSIQLGKITDFVQSVQLRRFGGRMPTIAESKASNFEMGKPTPEDIDKLDLLFSNFWKTVENNTIKVNKWEREITDATNNAALYIGKRKHQLSLFSRVISVAYICLFFIGSLVSIVSAIKRGAA